MELFMQDVPVFLLYADSTEAMALDAEDISCLLYTSRCV